MSAAESGRRRERDGTVACSSCHDLASGGADRRARSVGIDRRSGDVDRIAKFLRTLTGKMPEPGV